MKKIFFIIAIMLLFSSVSFAEEVELIPLRKTIEDNGGEVHWIQEEKRVDFSYNGFDYKIWIDKEHLVVDYIYLPMKFKPTIINSRTVLPKAFYNEVLGLEISE